MPLATRHLPPYGRSIGTLHRLQMLTSLGPASLK
jgi:hypothetical protein